MNITNKKQLLAIMTKEGLTSKEVASLLNRTEKTVFSWRSKRNTPDWVIPVLELKLSQR